MTLVQLYCTTHLRIWRAAHNHAWRPYMLYPDAMPDADATSRRPAARVYCMIRCV